MKTNNTSKTNNPTQKEKLEKVIAFAVERGFILPKWMYDPKSIEHLGSAIIRSNYTERLLFDHSFAKAVFGEGMETQTRVWTGRLDEIKKRKPDWLAETKEFPAWMVHLQQAVLDPKPIQYYADYVEKQRKLETS